MYTFNHWVHFIGIPLFFLHVLLAMLLPVFMTMLIASLLVASIYAAYAVDIIAMASIQLTVLYGSMFGVMVYLSEES